MAEIDRAVNSLKQAYNITRELEITYKRDDEEDPFSDRPGLRTTLFQRHTLRVPNHWKSEPSEINRYELAHELVIASWIEHKGPIFVLSSFAELPNVSNYFAFHKHVISPDHKQMIRDSQRVTDIWILDAIEKTERDTSMIQEALDNALKTRYVEDTTLRLCHEPVMRDFLLTYAFSSAIVERYGIEGHEEQLGTFKEKIAANLSERELEIAENLSEHFASLGELPDNEEESLNALEEAAQKTADIFGFPIVPVMRVHYERSVWDIEARVPDTMRELQE